MAKHFAPTHTPPTTHIPVRTHLRSLKKWFSPNHHPCIYRHVPQPLFNLVADLGKKDLGARMGARDEVHRGSEWYETICVF